MLGLESCCEAEHLVPLFILVCSLVSEILYCVAQVVSKLLSKDRNHVVKTLLVAFLVVGEKGTEGAVSGAVLTEVCLSSCETSVTLFSSVLLPSR